MIDSRCGLHCTGCNWKDTNACGGCIETNGHPFHGECPVAKCCQEKEYTHCGECSDIPNHCGASDCQKVNETGYHLCDNCEKTTCGKLHAYSYTDTVHGDNPPGARVEQCKKWKMLSELQEINISEIKAIDDLNLLNGDYINLECQLPNGTKAKILDDNKKYYAAEVCVSKSDKCYGIAIDETQIAIFKYGSKGVDAELVYWRMR